MAKNVPTSYDELADILDRLPQLCLDTRRRLGLSQRAASEQIGVAFSTISRFENGEDAALRATAIPILRWVAKS